MFARIALLSLALIPSLTLAQKKQFTLEEWQGRGRGGLRGRQQPSWTSKGDLLVWTGNKAVRLDPKTLKETPAFDGQAIERGIDAIVHPAGVNPLPRPTEVDESGTHALYKVLGHYYMADFKTSAVADATIPEDAKDFNLSPDGEKVAYVWNNDLYVFDSASKKRTRLTLTGTETILNGTVNWVYWEEVLGRRDIGFWWSPDSKAIAFLETDESEIPLSYFVDHRYRNDELITQRYPKAGGPNPKVRVGVTEIDNPQVKWAGPSQDTYEWVVRVKWLPDGQRFAIQTLDQMQTDITLTFAPRTGGPGKTILHEHDDAYINMSDDLTFIKGGKEFIWPSERTGYYHLYRYSEDGKLLNAITKGDWALITNPGPFFWIRQALDGVDEKNGWIYASTNRGKSIDRQMIRAKLDGSKIEDVTQGSGSHAIAMSPAANFYLDTFSSKSTPSGVTLRKTDGSTVKSYSEPDRTGFDAYNLALPDIFTIPARDGFPMPAELYKPHDFDPKKKYPVIIYCYGGPSAPQVINNWDNPGWTQVLAEEGYLVLSFDNRTATAISKKLESLSVKQYMGTVELNDLVDAARWLKKQSYIDPERVGIWGWSNGGTYTALGMMRSTEFKAGIAVAAIADQRIYDSKWSESILRTPQVNGEGYDSVALQNYAKDLHGRLLFVHGTGDDNVHPQQLWRFVDKLIDAGKTFDMMLYPMRKHGISDTAAQHHLYKLMMEFWKKNL